MTKRKPRLEKNIKRTVFRGFNNIIGITIVPEGTNSMTRSAI